ncbi:NAD(P)-dependent oxidoreductase [Pseudoxanthobacter sp. M-2]|uniref:NAD(P)-dependent oxidoreductase n=1 Tax=Pseudoxanthobacter sp. M-2 TaxID=3078754 RepID=UPI0038FBE5BA
MDVGIVGLGIMGGSIARNLLERGHAVAGVDLDPARREAFAGAGGRLVESPAALVGDCAVVLTSLPSEAALAAVSAELAEAIAKSGTRTVVCELSTMPIPAKEAARKRLETAGAVVLDCPLSGTGAQAVTRDLVVYASGDRAGFEIAEPALRDFSRRVVHVGAFGNGTRMKLVANLLVAIHNVATAEAMALAESCGLSLTDVIDVVSDGAGGSRIFSLRAPLMAETRYTPATMKLDVWMKDMKVIGELLAEGGVEAPLFSASLPVYEAAIDQVGPENDTAAVFEVLRPARRG